MFSTLPPTQLPTQTPMEPVSTEQSVDESVVHALLHIFEHEPGFARVYKQHVRTLGLLQNLKATFTWRRSIYNSATRRYPSSRRSRAWW